MFVLFNGQTMILSKIVERKTFLLNQGINIMYPNEKNVIMMPNREKYKDYCRFQHMSHLASKL